MERLLTALAGSINLTHVPEVPEESASAQLTLPAGTALIPGDNGDEYERSRCRYTDFDAAHLLSHLTAIRHAYDQGHDLVLILEHEIIMDKEALECGRSLVENAPEDWQILQVSTREEFGMDHSRNLFDTLISWMPDHAGTGSYFINRGGMQRVLQRTCTGQGVQNAAYPVPHALRDCLAWSVREPCMLLADELLYYSANTYTAVRPVFQKMDQSAGSSSAPRKRSTLNCSKGNMRLESVLVIQASSVYSEEELDIELERLKADAMSLWRWHKATAWRVHLVASADSIAVTPTQLEDLASLGVRLVMERKIVGRYNKYRFVALHVKEFRAWDYVLLKDSDMRISGFPWNTFMERKAEAVIAGPIRQSREEGLWRNRVPGVQSNNSIGEEQWFQIHQAHHWKRFGPAFLSQTKVQEVDFLEMYFTLFAGAFAEFYFGDILVTKFVQGTSAWGPDEMWCEAAREWVAPTSPGRKMAGIPRRGCVLVPVTACHEDSRSIAKNTLAQGHSKPEDAAASRRDANNKALGIFHRNHRHAMWMKASKGYRDLFGGTSKQPGLKRFFAHMSAGHGLKRQNSVIVGGGRTSVEGLPHGRLGYA